MRLALIGATGYAGLELLRILSRRQGDELVLVTSRKETGRRLTEIFPALAGEANYNDLTLTAPTHLSGQADIYLLAAQHGAAMNLVPELLRDGAKVIDLSADFRLKSAQLFDRWYGPHSSPELLPKAVYGLVELYRQSIATASLIANPGCYPTSIILALAPILKASLLDDSQVIVADSKSGVTGAGRGASQITSFCEVSDNFRAYKVSGHRHSPEIIQELSILNGQVVKLTFTPHLVPMNRGILSTIYLKIKGQPKLVDLREIYLEFYRSDRFVRVRPLDYPPETADVRGTNYCDLGLFYDQESELYKIVSVIDNLCRGAAGQAVANLNLMTGRPEDLGLSGSGLRP
ncbi:MAG: N-acetyl-gamma-glutamyl-phosphate reductase [Deltaproteobacteria bacterium]|jgi:N-acetyl-gamma-glutamyl-phosphate reductase|nr:N-acetyl-gamma-glutamyl-phosphate reductase [Deltaproteobacteria bacterium]